MVSQYGRSRSYHASYGGHDYHGSNQYLRHGQWEETRITTASHIALANVLARQKTSLLDKRMFMVRSSTGQHFHHVGLADL